VKRSSLSHNYCHSGTPTNLFLYAGRICSQSFGIQSGTRQGSLLSSFLFTRYIREVLSGIIDSNIGCNIGGYMVKILAYADDLVLLAPSWRALQQLLDKLQVTAGDIDMCCNSKKTVCMIFSPKCRTKTVTYQFPNFTINNEQLSFVNEFKYLGHIINNNRMILISIENGEIYSIAVTCWLGVFTLVLWL